MWPVNVFLIQLFYFDTVILLYGFNIIVQNVCIKQSCRGGIL